MKKLCKVMLSVVKLFCSRIVKLRKVVYFYSCAICVKCREVVRTVVRMCEYVVVNFSFVSPI